MTGVQTCALPILHSFPYFVFVTFGNDAAAHHLLPIAIFQMVPNDLTFWGIASEQRIKSVHFGLEDEGVTTSGSFAIDNLVILPARLP